LSIASGLAKGFCAVMSARGPQLLQPTTPEAIADAKAMIRTATHAALAAVEAGTGHPLASRVGVACLADGTPVIVISALAAHRAALRADPRCSLLIGEVGKGDPLASARISLVCRAEMIEPGSAMAAEARERYLSVHPKAGIYVDLPDFRFFRLVVERANLNGGFGRAFGFSGEELVEETSS
jgi:putative heme iron utilization protein